MNAKITIKLAKRLRALRKKDGLTQEEAAARAGLEYKHYQKLENKNPPAARITTLEKVAKGFKISLSGLLNFK